MVLNVFGTKPTILFLPLFSLEDYLWRLLEQIGINTACLSMRVAFYTYHWLMVDYVKPWSVTVNYWGQWFGFYHCSIPLTSQFGWLFALNSSVRDVQKTIHCCSFDNCECFFVLDKTLKCWVQHWLYHSTTLINIHWIALNCIPLTEALTSWQFNTIQ